MGISLKGFGNAAGSGTGASVSGISALPPAAVAAKYPTVDPFATLELVLDQGGSITNNTTFTTAWYDIAHSTLPKSTGKWGYQVTYTGLSNFVGIGIQDVIKNDANGNNAYYRGDGKIWSNKSLTLQDGLATWNTQVMEVLFDADARTVKFKQDGVVVGTPTTLVGSFPVAEFVAYISGTYDQVISVDFGAGGYTPSEVGYSNWA